MNDQSVGSIHYDLKLDKSKFDASVAQVNSQIATLGNKFTQVGSEFADLGKKMVIAGGAIVAGVAIIGIKTASSLETARQGFVTLLGSAQKADDIMAKIKVAAAKTPFEVPGLTQATQMLSSITKDGDRALKFILNVGEGLAAMGRGQAELDRISVNLQQIAAMGHAQMIDIKQFAFAGIPIFEMLQKETGKSGEALNEFVTNGGVTFQLLEKMFDNATKSGGRFFGAFQNQAGTFSQLMSNFKDSFQLTAADIVRDSGLFDKAKEALARFSQLIQDNKGKIIEFTNNGVKVLGEAFSNFIKVIKELYDWYGKLPAPLQNLIDKFIIVLTLLPPAAFAIQAISKVLHPFIGLLQLAKGAFTTLGAALGVGGGWAAIIVGLFVVIGVAVYQLIKNWDSLSEKARIFFSIIGGPITLTIAMIQRFRDVIDNLHLTWSGFVNMITTTVTNAFNGVLNWFAQLPQKLGMFIQASIQWLMQLPERIAYFLGYILGLWIKFVFIDTPIFLANLVVTVGTWFSNMGLMAINKTIELVTAVVNFMSSLPARIWNVIASLPSIIANVFTNTLNWLRNNVPNIINSVANFFKELPNKIIDALGNLSTQLYNKLKSIASSAWEGFKKGLGIHSPSYIEKAFSNIRESSLLTVKQLQTDVNKLNSLPTVIDPVSGILSGNPATNVTNSQTISQGTQIYGDVNIGSQQDARYFFKRIDRSDTLESMGLSPIVG